MSTPIVYSLSELADSLGLEYSGNPETRITGLASLESADNTRLGFCNNPRYLHILRNTRAAAVIVKPEHAAHAPCPVLITSDPYLAFARASSLFARPPRFSAGIHPTALIAPTARIDANASIGPYVVVGEGSVVEAGSSIGAHSSVGEDCRVGEGTVLNASVTLYNDVHIGKKGIVHDHPQNFGSIEKRFLEKP